ncbi:hypothetical protein HUJ05_011092 [Dendroctonus ponderosae]|nr:hypothetical protein HUJ05_011092 [Dendroctonus ponderosae]
MLLLLVLLQLGLPPFQAAPDAAPEALLFYVDSAPAPSRPKPLALLSLQPPLQEQQVAEHVKQLFEPPGAPERAHLLAQGTQVLPRQAPGRFVYLNGRPGLNQSPIVPEDRVNPGSVYHQRVYHNQQKIPLLAYGPRAQQAPRNTFFASAPRAAPQRPPHQLQQIDRPSAPPPPAEEEEDDAEEEEEEEDAPENLEEDEDEDNKDDNSGTVGENPSNPSLTPPPLSRTDAEAEEDPEDAKEEEEDEEESSDEHFFSPRPKFRKFRYESDKDDAEDTDESKQSVNYQQPPPKKKKKKSKGAGAGPEGGYSHLAPVTHQQKIYKERWYLSRDLEGAAGRRLS